MGKKTIATGIILSLVIGFGIGQLLSLQVIPQNIVTVTEHTTPSSTFSTSEISSTSSSTFSASETTSTFSSASSTSSLLSSGSAISRSGTSTSTSFLLSSNSATTSESSGSLSNCSRTSVLGLVPLNDLGNNTFLGYAGGLYPNGQNTMPTSHLKDGLALASQIVPKNSSGNPSPKGKIVLLTIGFSNTLIESSAFFALAQKNSSLNPALIIINGAKGGRDASMASNPSSALGTDYWTSVSSHLASAGVTSQQVQVVWMKEVDASPSSSPTSYAKTLAAEQTTILQILKQKFPSLKLVYLSSRIYGGYASEGSPEPYAYAGGFATKWTIESQLNGSASLNYNASLGQVKAPWIAWGPYMWANGLTPRSDGLTWRCSDFRAGEGLHPSQPQGADKVANMLMNFFVSDPTTRTWFLRFR